MWKLKYAFRLEPEISSLELNPPFPLGNIHHDVPLRVILEFLVPKIPSGTNQVTLAEGSLRLTIPSREIPLYNMRLILGRPVTTTPSTNPPPQEIMIATERITLYRMQDKARNEYGAGDIEKATRHLENLASRLISHGQHKLAQTVSNEVENLRQQNMYSEDGEKKIKYGTRALLLPGYIDGKIL